MDSVTLICEFCEAPFEAKRSDARFCSDAHRQASFRDLVARSKGNAASRPAKSHAKNLGSAIETARDGFDLLYGGVDIPRALEAASRPQLEEWETELSRLLGNARALRKAVTAELER